MRRGGAIKRSTFLKRRKPINKQSEKHLDYEMEYWERSQTIHLRSGGFCEILAAHDCDRFCTNEPHHRKMRSQGGSNSLDNLLDVCFSGHIWIHQQLPRKKAEDLGLLVPRDTPEYPYLGHP